MTDIININTKDKVIKLQDEAQLQVVKCLKQALNFAEEGKFEGIAMVLKRVDIESCTTFRGGKVSHALIGGFETLKLQMCSIVLQSSMTIKEGNNEDDDK